MLNLNLSVKQVLKEKQYAIIPLQKDEIFAKSPVKMVRGLADNSRFEPTKSDAAEA